MIQGLNIPPGLSYAQIRQWNQFIKSGVKGRSLDEYFSQFKKQNPTSDIDPTALRSDLGKLKGASVQMAKGEHKVSSDDTNTGYLFPEMEFNGKSYGPVNGDMKTEVPLPVQSSGIPERSIRPDVPSEINDLQFDEQAGLPYYTDPHTGDIQYVAKNNLSSPRFNPEKAQGMAGGLFNQGIKHTVVPPGAEIRTINKESYYVDPATKKLVIIR